MHNIHKLEQRWLKYKIKSYMPLIITFIFSIVLAVTLYLIFNSKNNNETKLANKHIEKEKALKEENTTEREIIKTKKEEEKSVVDSKHKVVSKRTEKVQEDTKEKIILTPSLDFMKKLRTDSIHSYGMQNSDNSDNSYYANKEETQIQERSIEEEYVQEKNEKTQAPQISISRKEDRSDLQDVIKRFKKNNNPALSLFVAKKYYKFGDYQKAYNYALITNEINNDIEQSWIIFAKSLVKLNKRKKAIETLTRYVNHSGSGNAKVLLDNIKSGKFK